MSGDSSQQILQRAKWSRIAAHFLGYDVELQSVDLISTGLSGAELIRVETHASAYLLRQWSFESVRQTFPLPRIQELHCFLQHLSEHEIPVAVPLGFRNGSQTIIPEGSDIWHCEPWLPGEPVSGKITAAQLTSMMHSLAKLHSAATTFTCSSLGQNWFRCHTDPCPTVAERCGLIRELSKDSLNKYREALEFAPSNFKQIGNRILEHYRSLVSTIELELRTHLNTPVHLQPCWRDLWRDNVLFAGEALSGFIDPTATRTDHIATDISRLLGGVIADDRSQWDKALQIYSDVRPLSPQDVELIQVFDRSSVLLSGLTWLRRWSDRELKREDIPKVLPRLQEIEQRMAHLR